MKKTMLMLGLFLLTISVKAQDTMSILPYVEQFVNAPGNAVGTVLYDSPDYHVSLMKYVDPFSKDSILGIVFYKVVYSENTFIKSELHNFVAFLDIDEVKPILSWIDFIKKQLKTNPTFEYLSYVPKRGNVLLAIHKSTDKDFWFWMRYDKLDTNSQEDVIRIPMRNNGFDYRELDKFYNMCTDMLKIIEAHMK